MAGLKKAGSNWVDGDRFFDREAELDVLTERVRNGTHTLLTAQRRMGKTSLVRELPAPSESRGALRDGLRRSGGCRYCGGTPWSRSGLSHGTYRVHGTESSPGSSNVLREVDDRVDTLAIADVLRVKLRAGIDRGSWRQKGDAVCAALAKNERPVVLAIDELPILVNRMLKDHDYCITPGGKKDVDEFLSWLRKNGQDYRDRICLILSGSVGLEPILRQAGLSAHANIFSPLDLKPWDEKDRARLPCRARGDLPPQPAPRRA